MSTNSREIYDTMEDYVRADVTRVRLDSILLDLMVWNFGPAKDFLASLLSPPPVEHIENSLKDLLQMDAITEEGYLTKFGRRLANLHLDPHLGKMLIYATIFNCVDPITSVVAFLSYKDLFMMPLGNKKGRREIKSMLNVKGDPDQFLSGLMEIQLDLDGDQCSDHMVRVKAVQEYRTHKDTDPEFCYENYLNESTMIQVMAMRSQIIKNLARNKFIAKAKEADLVDNHRTNNTYLHMIRSVICAGLYPNTAGVL